MAGNSKPENALARNPLTQERLKELLNYDPETGNFTRVLGSWRGWGKLSATGGVGCVSLRPNGGYIKICVDYHNEYAHRLAFLYMTGAIPTVIDHVDCDGTNNRWANLREATQSQNLGNARRKSTNTSGFKGVYWHRGDEKWMARIQIEKIQRYLGSFDDPEEAHKVYMDAAINGFGKFARSE